MAERWTANLALGHTVTVRRKTDDDNLPYADETLPRGQAMREFAEWVTGAPLPPGEVAPNDFRITDALINRMVIHSLATLHALADRGHFKAAQFIVQLGLGSTEKPFTEQAQVMEREEVRERLIELYQRKGLSQAMAEKMVDAKLKPALPAAETKNE